MRHIYSVTEEDTDGKGTNITQYIQSDEYLMKEERDILEQCLNEAKQESDEKDTDEKVQSALEKFTDKTGIPLQMIAEDDFIQYCFTF